MKNQITALSIFLFIAFFSCSDSNSNKFIGTWKNRDNDTIEVKIIKDKDKYLVSTLVKGKESSTLTYKLNDSLLTNISPKLKEQGIATDIYYVTASGKLLWGEIEFEKTSN